MKATTAFERESVYSWCESGRFPCSENVFDCLSILLNGLKICRKIVWMKTITRARRARYIHPCTQTYKRVRTQTCIEHATRAFVSVWFRTARQILQVFRRFEGISSSSRNALKFFCQILTHSQNPDADSHEHAHIRADWQWQPPSHNFHFARHCYVSAHLAYLCIWGSDIALISATTQWACVCECDYESSCSGVAYTIFFYFYLAFSCAGHQLRRRRQQWPISSAKFYEWLAEWAFLRWQQCMGLRVGVSEQVS